MWNPGCVLSALILYSYLFMWQAEACTYSSDWS